MKALLSLALAIWFFGVLFLVNRAQASDGDVEPVIVSPHKASAGEAIISFDHYNHKPDTSDAFHFLRDSLYRQLQNHDKLKITAHYTRQEAQADRNIGLKRANSIRALFEGYVDLDRIEIDSRLSGKVSTPTSFDMISSLLTQNALDTPYPPMTDVVDKVGSPKEEKIGIEPVTKESALDKAVTSAPEKEEPTKTAIADFNRSADYVIYFGDESSNIIGASEVQQYLDALSIRIKKSKEKIEITGYDDNTRTKEESLVLANRRTYRVRKAFTDKYVRRKLVKVKNIGQSSPMVPNNTPGGRSKNRRVEIRILEN